MDIIWRLALIIFPISKVDPWLILLRGKEGFGGFEADRLRDRILSTQRMSRGRDLDFIYATNSARPGVRCWSPQTFYGTLFWWQFMEQNECYSQNKTISALRALVLQNLLRTTSGFSLTYIAVWSMVCSACWGRGWWKSSFKRKMNDCSMTFQKFPRCARLGAMFKKRSISR